MFTSLPGGNYTEIGTLDITVGGLATRPKDLTTFKEDIRPHVCQAGCDAAVGLANNSSAWIKAVVLKAVPNADGELASSTPAQPGRPESTGGCSYDTQCKGDRICEDGRCVDP